MLHMGFVELTHGPNDGLGPNLPPVLKVMMTWKDISTKHRHAVFGNLLHFLTAPFQAY